MEIYINGWIFFFFPDRKTLKENSYILNKCSDLAQMVNVDKHSILMLRISKKIDVIKLVILFVYIKIFSNNL